MNEVEKVLADMGLLEAPVQVVVPAKKKAPAKVESVQVKRRDTKSANMYKHVLHALRIHCAFTGSKQKPVISDAVRIWLKHYGHEEAKKVLLEDQE